MRAIIVLCEGNHDEVFIRRSLGATKDWSFLTTPVLELPTPFGEAPAAPGQRPPLKSLILTHHEARRVLKLPLREAAHPPLPAFHSFLRHTECGDLIALVRCHGDSKSDTVKALVRLVRRSINAEAITAGIQITEYALAFVFDADSAIADREAMFRAAYANTFTNLDALSHNTWIRHGDVPVGLFIFANDQGKGTIEDVLISAFEARWPNSWAAADTFLTDHCPTGAPALRTDAERLKAQMTITGQPFFPGDPLSVVIDRDDKNLGLPPDAFRGPTSQALVQFLQSAPFTP
ncbi:hypothetical protein L6R49_10705 [Myxococcota bacterium]|nr:hypothetical protein [Myxococcota bacterium]